MGGKSQAVLEDGRFDLFTDAVGVRAARSWQLVDQPIRAEGLIVAPYLIELLPRVAHDLAGLADVLQVLGQF